MKYKIEVTDTFGGEANYSWVRRYDIDVNEDISELSFIRLVKKTIGWNGLKCKREKLGGTFDEMLIPRKICQVCFIMPQEF